jgi:outer membrane protein TolC
MAACASLALAAHAHAETLAAAWHTALAENPAVRAAEARAGGAAAELEAALAAHRPTVVASTSVNRFADPLAFDFAAAGIPARVPLFGGDSVTLGSAQLTMPLYTSGMLHANVAAATAGVTAQQRSAQTVIESTKLAVAEAYVGVLRAASGLAAAQAAAASLAAHARDAEDMERSGQAPRSDRLAASVSLADGEQRRLEAQNALELARSAYNRRLGRPLTAAVELAPELAPLGAALQRPLDELVAAALANRAEIDALTAVAAAFDARAAAKRAERGPQLLLTGGYNFIENTVLDREDYWSVGLGIQWRLFDSGRTRSAAAALAQSATAAAHDVAPSPTLRSRRPTRICA